MAAAAVSVPPEDLLRPPKRNIERTTKRDLPVPKRRKCNFEDSHISKSSSGASLSTSEDIIEASISDYAQEPPASENGKIFKCTYEGCHKSFNRPARLRDHVNSHTQERPHKCPHEPCDKSFLRQSHLSHHIKSAHTEVRDYVCEHKQCGKSYSTGTRLRRHIASVHEGKEELKCTGYPGCSKTFRKKSTLQNHIDKDHLDRKPFPCLRTDETTGEQCDKAYQTEFKLLDHQRKHHAPARFTCSECPPNIEFDGENITYGPMVYFATQQDLAIHVQQVHPPRCEACSRTFSTSRELEKHIEALHSGKSLEERRTFCCAQLGCRKAFTKQSNLNQHIRSVHEESQRFVCGVTNLSTSKDVVEWTGDGACHESFSTKQRLENHVRVQHLGRKNGEAKNRKQLRHDRKSGKRETNSLSTIAALTGDGYATETGRDITCIIPGCEHLFYRQYDLELHLQASHGMETNEIREAVSERDALNGGKFWLGGIDPYSSLVHQVPEQEDVVHRNENAPNGVEYAGGADDSESATQSLHEAILPQECSGVRVVDLIDPVLFEL